MTTHREMLQKTANNLMSGKDAHVENLAAVEGLGWETAGRRLQGVPHSIFQLLNHMVYWQEWAIRWFDDQKPAIPELAAASWPGQERPASTEAWSEAVERFRRATEALMQRSDNLELLVQPGKSRSRLEMLQLIGSHTSYHIGQVVLLRQMLGAWPPPSGGLTW